LRSDETESAVKSVDVSFSGAVMSMSYSATTDPSVKDRIVRSISAFANFEFRDLRQDFRI
jgi:hypothetical protein